MGTLGVEIRGEKLLLHIMTLVILVFFLQQINLRYNTSHNEVFTHKNTEYFFIPIYDHM